MSPASRVQISVLVVDDDSILRNRRRKLLEEAGFAVQEAGSTDDVQTIASTAHLLVLAACLPRKFPHKICQQLRARAGTDLTPILILFDAATPATERAEALEQGADGCLLEPIIPVEFLAQVRALLRSRPRLPLDRLPLGYVRVDANHRVRDWNLFAEKMFGFTKEEALGQSPLDLIVAPRLLPHLQEIVGRIEAGDMEAHSINENRTKQGRTIICEWLNTPLSDAAGNYCGAIGLVQDITLRQHVEERLHRSEALLREAEHLARMGSWEWHIPTNQMTWSDGLYQIFGLRPAEFAVNLAAFFDRVHPEDREKLRTMNAQALRDHAPIASTYRIIRPDGSIRILEGKGQVSLDHQLQPIRLFSIAQDVTQRKEAEDKLRETSTKLQALSHQLLTTQERERRHLARELHDEFGQLLATLNVQLHAAKSLAGPAALPTLEECRALVVRAGEQVRNLAHDLRPTMLDILGLEATLQSLLQRFRQRTNCAAELKGHLAGPPLRSDLAITCFRLVQEALTNVMRHAQAKEVCVELEQQRRTLRVLIRDNGSGFDVPTTLKHAVSKGSFGLLGLIERVVLQGGNLAIDSAPGRGTCLAAAFPLSVPHETAQSLE